LTSQNIYQKARERDVDSSPEEFKNYFVEVLDQKEVFLNVLATT